MISAAAIVALAWIAIVIAANRGRTSRWFPSSPDPVWPRPCVGCRRWRVPSEPACCAPKLEHHSEGGPYR